MERDTVMRVVADPLAQELLHSPLLARLAYNGPDVARAGLRAAQPPIAIYGTYCSHRSVMAPALNVSQNGLDDSRPPSGGR